MLSGFSAIVFVNFRLDIRTGTLETEVMSNQPPMFHEVLRRMRTERGVLSAKVADAIGISRSYYSDVERGRVLPLDSDRLDSIVEALRLTEDEEADLRASARRTLLAAKGYEPQEAA